MKNKKMIIALAVPFLVIIVFLVKIYHTVDSSRDSFTVRGGQVFVEEQFMQDFDAGVPISKAIYAVVQVRKQTDILKKVAEQKEKNKETKRYEWLAVAVKDKEDKNWLVTYRENHIVPKVLCHSKVNIENGKASPITCEISNKK